MMTVHTVAGDGVLARHGELVLLCSAGDSVDPAVVDEVLEAHRMAADEGGDGSALADAVKAAVTGSSAGSGLSVVAFAPSAGSLVVTVFGRGWVIVATEYGEQRLAPRNTPPEGLRSTVPGAVLSIRAGVGDVDDNAPVQRWSNLETGTTRAGGLVLTVAEDLPADLVPVTESPAAPRATDSTATAGAPVVADPAPSGDPARPDLAKHRSAEASGVPAAMVTGPVPDAPPLAAAVPPAADAGAQPPGDVAPVGAGPPELPSVPTPEVAVDRTEPFSAVVLVGRPDAATDPGGAAVDRAPLPIASRPAEPDAPDAPLPAHPREDDNAVVVGVYCKNGHFDDPAARYCAVCGISMAQQTLVPRPGPRPPLGVLVLDDGSIFSLDADYVVGRDPSRDPDVVSGAARPLRIDDPEGLLSRVHARIHLDGWEVAVIDLGSANGTGVWGPRDAAWTRAPSRSPIVVRPGTQIGIGRRQMRYESHRNT